MHLARYTNVVGFWFFFLLYIYIFLFGFYGPFKNISLIPSRSFIKGGRKRENLGKKGFWFYKMGYITQLVRHLTEIESHFGQVTLVEMDHKIISGFILWTYSEWVICE